MLGGIQPHESWKRSVQRILGSVERGLALLSGNQTDD